MAGKRTATSELNHENWEDYEPEEAGTFKKASEDVLQHRVIRTARRRGIKSSAVNESETSGKNVFSSFGGFTKTTTPASSPFAFLSTLATNTSTPAQSNTNGLSNSTSTTFNSHKIGPDITTTPTPTQTPDTATITGTSTPTDQRKPGEKSEMYYAKLKGLNESVSQWIKTHVDKNPFCILTPVFKDYEKHLQEIEAHSDLPEPTKKIADSAPKHSHQFSAAKPPEKKAPFSFGSAASGFSFGSGAPFTFSNVAGPTSASVSASVSATGEENEAEEDEPPKVEFKPVVEDGSVFSMRCKVFVKKEGSFGDRGVGQLFLKPVAGSEKTQLIVRADTNLGNLLLNFILGDSVPLQRMGKNNVMVVCVPTPEMKPPPTPVLLRVKTAQEADELLKILEKHKK